MKLWLLTIKNPDGDSGQPNQWANPYDKAFGFVVRAKNENDARDLAESWHGDESRNIEVWKDRRLTSCDELTTIGSPMVILRDYLGG